jgi:sterol 14-demethylase
LQEYFAKWGQQGMVDLKQELDKLLMLISGRCLLGKEVREKMFDEFFTLFHELSDNGMCLTSVLFPYAPTPSNRRRDKARAKLSEMLTEIVRSRKKYDNVESDVLQNLIDSKYADGRSTTEAEVIGLIITLLFLGKHTSTITSVWTGAHLLASTRSLASVLEEQKKIVRKYGDDLDYNAFLEMDTLHRCIKETLRIHPPVPMFRRKVHKNFTVQTKDGNEYEIHRGHTLISPVQFNGNLPHIYKDPDVYDPDRFGPGREEDRVGGKFSYTSFSAGRHACLGESYAYLQIKVIWSYLLRNFELKLESPFPKPDWTKLVPEPKGRVMVSYKKRVLPTI